LYTAKCFLNVPYLWGGRSLFGIDCSGLTQVVFKINHIKIPRDTSQQVLSGKPVDRFEDARQGDLAFFSNEEGKISHVGILMAPDRILHASGYVRIDQFDSKGIFNTKKQLYTHRFNCIRRLL
jgi:cell wall-associated NlpC family hydrolase